MGRVINLNSNLQDLIKTYFHLGGNMGYLSIDLRKEYYGKKKSIQLLTLVKNGLKVAFNVEKIPDKLRVNKEHKLIEICPYKCCIEKTEPLLVYLWNIFHSQEDHETTS